MVTLAQLRDLKCSEFEEAADAWGKISNQAGALRDQLDHKVISALRDEQEGEAAKQAMKRLERLSRNYHYLHAECGLIRTALNGLATELTSSQRKLKAALEEAHTQKCIVRSDGSVRYQAQPPLAPERNDAQADGFTLTVPHGPQARAQDIADRIASALSDAAEIDARYAKTLGRLRTNGDLKVTTAIWDDALKDMNAVRKTVGDYLPADSIPQDKSPKENAEWWDSLTQEERDQYVSLHPASIGALDGIPAEVRDDANRTVFVETYADIKAKLEEHVDNEPSKTELSQKDGLTVESSEWRKWREDREYLNSQLAGMEAIQKRFDATGKEGLPEAYLLGFSPDGNGRAIIANGNPDTADHTAVYVPGTESNLSDVKTGIKRMNDLWKASNSIPTSGDISTITWYGYDAPQNLYTEAWQGNYAHKGGPPLNEFLDGLGASHDEDVPQHTTVVGHSYGTTTIGSAAIQGDLNADDVIFAGSPGARVGRATDMDVPEGHVWNEEADGDPVPDIGRVFHGGTTFDMNSGLTIGIIPSDEIFGANQMSTDTKGHSDYWKPGSLSLKNQAAVVTGNYDLVQHDD